MNELKQKPNGVWFLETQVPDGNGGLRRARVGLDTKDKTSAEAQRRDWIAGVHPKHPAVGGIVAPKGVKVDRPGSTRQKTDTPYVSSWLSQCLSEEDVWRDCRASATHQSNVRILSRLLPSDLEIGQLTSAHVEDLRRSLRDDHGYAPASVRKLLGSLSAAARYAVKRGHLAAMPEFPTITVKNEKDRTVSLDEEAAMFECIRARQAAEPLRAWWAFEQLMVVLLDTGCRLGEAMLAGPSWVKRKRLLGPDGQLQEGTWLAIPRTVRIDGKDRVVTKNGKPRDVPLTRRALAAIALLNERAVGPRWFPWALNSSGPLYLLQNVREDMKARGFGFDDVVLHTMRHTCATRLAEGGLDLIALRDWLGHSDIKITAARYVHLMNGHVYRGAAILDIANGTGGAAGGNRDDDGTNLSKTDVLPSGNGCASPVMARVN